MRSDGNEVLARWREIGAWWLNEPPVEVALTRNSRGARKEEIVPLSLAGPPETQRPYEDNNKEEIALRPRKTRDEKVMWACGYRPAKPEIVSARTVHPYAPLHVLSGYSFGHSVLFAEEIPRLAATGGMPAACLADPFSLAGAFEFVLEAKRVGIKPLVGASLEMAEGGEVVLIARDKRGYSDLSRLITKCHLDEPRLYPLCTWERLERHAGSLLCLTGGHKGRLNRLLASKRFPEADEWVERLARLFGRSNVFVEIERSWTPWERDVERRSVELAEKHRLEVVAGGAVTHGRPEQFPAQDVALCAETLCLVDEIVGRKPQRDPAQPQAKPVPLRAINAERYLRTADEASELFAYRPEWLAATLRAAERCDDDVMPGRCQLPQVYAEPGRTLREAVFAGAQLRHKSIGLALQRRLETEIERIVRLDFANHFLVAWEVCRWAEQQNILFSGRGSVVDSAVAFCLGLSRIDAFAHRLHFDRFLPDDGSKRPDIDLDFEAKRRDDVREHMTTKYGKDRVATVAAFGAYSTRGIVREVGKALGIPNETLGFLSKRIHGGVPPDQLEAALDKRPELQGSHIERERFHWVFKLAGMLADVPRNVRAHSSGVVVCDRPLCETVPVMWGASDAADGGEGDAYLRLIQWDKRSAKHCFDKFDILCLRGQDVLSGAQERIRLNSPGFSVEQVSLEDEDTYRAMRSGELIGIPQSASPAMRQAHIRLKTENLHDASLVQAGIRPGVGGAVKINELILRRRGLKPYSFEHPDLETVLAHTYGIIVFQEQVDQLLQIFCDYSSGEAEDIRDKIHKRRREDYGQLIKDEVLARIRSRGYTESVAQQVFEMIAGFKGYGFAQGHALAFAEISIRSIWCQQNHPAPYFASLLDAQPAGYYGPCTLANEARARGVAMLPPDVNASTLRFEVVDVQSEQDPKLVFPGGGIRVSLGQIGSISRGVRERIVESRHALGAFGSLYDFCLRVQPARDELEQLILCGACDGLHPNRRAMLWAVNEVISAAEGEARAGGLDLRMEPPPLPNVPDFSKAEKAVHERSVLGMDVVRHLMAFERERILAKGGITSGQAKTLDDGALAIVVGNPIRLRFPPTPSGKRVVFFDLEDECGLLNVTCFDETYRRDGHAIVCSPYVTLIGRAQDRDGHTAFLAHRVHPYRPCLAGEVQSAQAIPIRTADFLVG